MTTADSSILVYLTPSEIERNGGGIAADEQAMLDTINQKVAGKESLKDLIAYLLNAGARTFPCDRIGLAFFEEDGQRAVAYSVETRYDPVVLKTGYMENIAGSSLKEIVDRGVVRIINDLEAYLREHPDSRSTQLLVQEGVRSNMTCPLTVEGRVVGVMFRSSRRPCAYDEHQALLHLRMAERLSQAVEKAWQIEQLRTANQAYLEMLAFVSHELKNPLASIITSTRLLTDGYMDPLTPRQAEWLNKIEHKAGYLMALIREYLDLARIESGPLHIHVAKQVDFMKEILTPAVSVTQDLIQQRHMTLTWPEESFAIEGDPSLLEIVLVNLLNNAAKYGKSEGRIRVTGRRTDKDFSVSVWNEGPGFQEADRDKLFRKFSRLKTPGAREQKGTGIGLYTCWRIVQLHGGRISARSEPGQWAEFTVLLPQPIRVA
ncbi:MAG TPA: hypothetical protein DCZ95_18005 [Verrucomicrobia bacterium]|nr:MAG: hypothetical protein A2X46_10780 [Lentisphaerae bacterium GWF2_57_35]HBA85982.1 hypothetical protein [Verrucomicrobiota bacterium]